MASPCRKKKQKYTSRIYPNIYTFLQMYIRYVQNARRRPGGGSPARPRAAGPVVFCIKLGHLVYICDYIFVYIWICLEILWIYIFGTFFGMVAPQGSIWPVCLETPETCNMVGMEKPTVQPHDCKTKKNICQASILSYIVLHSNSQPNAHHRCNELSCFFVAAMGYGIHIAHVP